MSICVDTAWESLCKKGEELCGDKVEIVRHGDDVLVVLSDGLGSGVKANILSTLTSKIIATMMANGMPVSECVHTIASTLPVCSQRHVAYSTFTIIQISNNQEAYLVQYDNPKAILLREGVSVDYPATEQVIDGKKILFSTIRLEPEDIFITMSDGALYAGVGMSLNFGWGWENIVEYM